MSSLFTNEGVAQIRQRFSSITPDTQRLWGKMDHAQMMEHCRKVLETATGGMTVKAPLIAKLLGPFLKKKFLREGKFNKNSPTGGVLKQFSGRPFDEERNLLLATLDRFSEAGREGKLTDRHPFFGKVTTDEWDRLQHMHLNHHLEQFGS